MSSKAFATETKSDITINTCVMDYIDNRKVAMISTKACEPFCKKGISIVKEIDPSLQGAPSSNHLN